MQPYFFPYIGYFQLIRAVDTFVVLDDVAFVKRGWINRNRVLINGRDSLVTVPVSDSSQNRAINETPVARHIPWADKLLRSLSLAYGRAPHFETVYPVVERCLRTEAQFISELALDSVRSVLSYLGVGTRVVPTAAAYGNAGLRGEARILDICQREQAAEYINLPGGKDLYHRERFADSGMTLRFLEPELVPYPQSGGAFIPALSIIDVLMYVSREEALSLLDRFVLRDADL